MATIKAFLDTTPDCRPRSRTLTTTPGLVAVVSLLATLAAADSEFQVNSTTLDYQGLPAISHDSSGNFIISWTSGPFDSSHVIAQRFSSGAVPIGTEFQINGSTDSFFCCTQVSHNSVGGFVVAWTAFDLLDPTTEVLARRFDSSGGALGPEFQVNIHSPDYQWYPHISHDSGGGFVVVWIRRGQDTYFSYDVFGQRFDSLGAPQGVEFQVNSTTPHDQRAPAISHDPAGGFVVVWQSDSHGQSLSWDVLGQRFSDSATPVGPEFQVNLFTTFSQQHPDVSHDSSGNFVVIWQSQGQDGSLPGIFGQRFDSLGGRLGGEFQVNTFTLTYQTYGTVSHGAEGGFVVAWQGLYQDGNDWGVFAQQFDSSGARVGTETQVNQHTPYEQLYPAVSHGAGGDFVIAWESDRQDGSGFGVFARSFATGLVTGPAKSGGSKLRTFRRD